MIVDFPRKPYRDERERRHKALLLFKNRNLYEKVIHEFPEEYRLLADLLVTTAFDAGWRSK